MNIFIITELNQSSSTLKKTLSYLTERGHIVSNLDKLSFNKFNSPNVAYESSLHLIRQSALVLIFPSNFSYLLGFLFAYALFRQKRCLVFETQDLGKLPSLYLGCTAANIHRKKVNNDQDIFTTLSLFKL